MAPQLTNDEFIKKAKKVHGDKYDYSKSNYISVHDKISIICKKHGIFYQTPNSHVSDNHGCPKCIHRISKNEMNYQSAKANWFPTQSVASQFLVRSYTKTVGLYDSSYRYLVS